MIIGIASFFGLLALYGAVATRVSAEREAAMADFRAFEEAYGHRCCDCDRAHEMAKRYFNANPTVTEVDLGGPGAFGKWTNYPRIIEQQRRLINE